jgi:hypothetical protein
MKATFVMSLLNTVNALRGLLRKIKVSDLIFEATAAHFPELPHLPPLCI